MRIGISSAQIGRQADPRAVKATAEAAEVLGYASVWVLDHRPGGRRLPVAEEPVLDPFVVLAAAAASTTRVRIGTGIVVAPWYPPAILARLLTSLDVISDGRLSVGLGSGRSGDEDLDEILDVLDAHWSDGDLLRPVQVPRPRLYLAGSLPGALERVARRADGWMPAGVAVEAIGPQWAQVRDRAAGFGRDPDELELVVRAGIELSDRPRGGERTSFCGSIEQVIEDVLATRAVGADEVILRLGGDPSVDRVLDVYARIAEAVGASSR